MNNKGFLKTLEAIIAIVILLGFILYIIPSGDEKDISKPFVVKNAQTYILDEIMYNVELRNCVADLSNPGGICDNLLQGDCADRITGVDGIINKNIPFGYSVHCEICETSISCSNIASVDAIENNVYIDTRFISKDPSDPQSLKVIRLYMWKK